MPGLEKNRDIRNMQNLIMKNGLMYVQRCLKKVYNALLLLNKSLSLEKREETSFLQNI